MAEFSRKPEQNIDDVNGDEVREQEHVLLMMVPAQPIPPAAPTSPNASFCAAKEVKYDKALDLVKKLQQDRDRIQVTINMDLNSIGPERMITYKRKLQEMNDVIHEKLKIISEDLHDEYLQLKNFHDVK